MLLSFGIEYSKRGMISNQLLCMSCEIGQISAYDASAPFASFCFSKLWRPLQDHHSDRN